MEIKCCKECGKELDLSSYAKRMFCNRSCSARFNNQTRSNMPKEQREKISSALKAYYKKNPKAIVKGEVKAKQVGKHTKGKYKKNISSILSVSKRTTYKIIKRLNLGCSNCGWNESTCDIHHINGRKIEDCDNHNNLSLLCPNCHRKAHTDKLKKEDLLNLNQTLPSNWLDSYYG